MKKMSVYFIWIALIVAFLGGLSRLTYIPFFVESRVWAGVAAILLLASIAINTLQKEN
ncbi:MAG: hypothetical protein HY746_05825 [Elusimicrobia bacterium]|nr:hypothetical protein [Elusimicrobiota bacterium]